jgi:SAM-dependent methyltransferase
MLADLQYRILKRIAPRDPGNHAGSFQGDFKIQTLLGRELLEHIRGKVVIDFGCGGGIEAVEFARRGARRVIGIDIREEVLEPARKYAAAEGLAQLCTFTTSTTERADVIVSLDSFEHFADPSGVLRIMDDLLLPDGQVIYSFGPTWYHPLGGHLFSVFPWAHLLFSESALLRWRSTFKNDGATRFDEVAGGLNQMTIRKFVRLVEDSPFTLAALEPVPIRKLKLLHMPLTREFTTAVVRGRLVRKRSAAP